MTGRDEDTLGGHDWVRETGRGPGRPARGRGAEVPAGDDVGGRDRDAAEPGGLGEWGGAPLYVRIANDIEELIHRGKLVAGDRVGSESELARQYKVSMKTSRKVHEALRGRGLAHTVLGAGTFVGMEGTTPAPAVMATYLVIADELAKRIRAGDIPVGGRIPSRLLLARRFQTSVVTAGEATAVLREKGWVYTVANTGHFVTSAERWPSEQEWQKTIARPRGRREERKPAVPDRGGLSDEWMTAPEAAEPLQVDDGSHGVRDHTQSCPETGHDVALRPNGSRSPKRQKLNPGGAQH